MKLAALLLAMTMLASCGSGASSPTTTPPMDPDAVVLSVETGGGLVPFEFVFGDLPEFVLFGDGRVVVPGPTPAIYPGPALPALVEYRISAAAVDELIADALAFGMEAPLEDYGYPAITDVATTTITLTTAGETRVAAVYAFGFTEEVRGDLTAEQIDARRNLALLVERLYSIPDRAPGEVVVPEAPYRIARLDVYARPGMGLDPPQPEQDWPFFSPADGAPTALDPATRCTTLVGADLAAALPVLQQATALTPWVADGEVWHLILRPLLPHEEPCTR